MSVRATKSTHSTMASSDVSIESGDTIIVVGGVYGSETATNVTFTLRNAADSATYGVIRVPANTTVPVDIPFVADAGLLVTCDTETANSVFTIFHSAGGA